MILPPAASAHAKNIKGCHRAAVNLTFCTGAIGMKALISFVQVFLSDPSSPELCTCVRGPNDWMEIIFRQLLQRRSWGMGAERC